jgi:signal transduction histidine kinase
MLELGFTDGFEIASGLVQAFVASVFLRFRSSRSEWGLGWLALCYGAAAALNLHLGLFWSGAALTSVASIHGLVAAVLGLTAVSALVVGVRRYTGASSGWDRAVFVGVWLAFMGLVALRHALDVGDALMGNLVTGALFLYLAWLFWQSAQREPNAGHGVAALMLALYVPLLGLATLIGMDQTEVRRWASVPFALAGLGIMSATMGRMRAQLREFNEQLEARVAERTRQLQDMISSLESFNSMVSHDLRGTLGGLSGLSAVAVQALQAGDAERAQRVMATVQRESGQMAQLVSDLLMLARLSQAEVHKQPVSLSAVVHETMSQLSLVYGDRVQQVVPAEPLGEVLADPSLLRQALVNLVGNALKFSARVPQPQVQVRAEPRDQGVLLTVHDNGEGFDPQRASELFQPFKRLHSGTRFEGSGVGLTIVQRIVERHGGRVWADSAPGQGATFSVWLPA